MKKKVLWLIHKELVCMSDIFQLLDLGYEVYTVKKVPWQARTEGLYITDEFEGSLTIDQRLKRELNQLTFFEPISDEMWETINQNFDMLFMDYYKEQFEMVLENFKGAIILRTLGLPQDGSYCNRMLKDFGLQIFSKIESLVTRFWVAPVYKWNLNVEAPVIQRRYVELPFSIRYKCEEKHEGTEERVYFLCPQIKINEDAEMLYRKTVEMFQAETGEPEVMSHIQSAEISIYSLIMIAILRAVYQRASLLII